MNKQEKSRDFGARLQDCIDLSGYKNADFARLLDLKPNTLSNYVNGVSHPPFSTLVRMVEILGVTIDFLLGVPGATRNAQVNAQVNAQLTHKNKINPTELAAHEEDPPSYKTTRTEFIVATQDIAGNPTFTVINHRAAANYLTGYQSQEYYENLGVVTLPRNLVGSSRQGIVLQVDGNSMEPKFHHGDWVACVLLDRGEWDQVRDLDCYIVVSVTHGIQFKRVKNRLSSHGFIRCKSDNRQHRSYNIEEENLLQLFRFVLHISPDASNPEDALYKKVDHLEDTTSDLRTMFEHMQEQLEQLRAQQPAQIAESNN
jgi:phage repressor protein C with HTH and peptisase S24 domain